MSPAIDGSVVVVTGAARGIGRASACAFAAAGARVVVADIDAVAGQETVARIGEAGGQGAFVRADVTKPADAELLVAYAVERFGRLDYAHNNAGLLGKGNRTADMAPSEWDRVIAVNLTGVFLCLRAEIRQMLRDGGGAIVNTSSAAGLVGSPNLPAYTAAKHGVAGLTKAAAIEYAREGIRVNAICPGPTRTPMLSRAAARFPEVYEHARSSSPMGRIAEPEEIAAAALWLCSPSASFLTGAVVPVDGGYVAP